MSLRKVLSFLLVTALALVLIAGCAPAAPAAPAAAPAAEEAAPAEAATEEAAAAEEAAPAEAAAACPDPSGEPIRIGVTMKFDDLWLTTMRDAMQAFADANPGVELIMVDSKEDVAVQLGQVENFVAQGMDAVVIVAANTDAVEPMTQAITEAGIPLVYVNRYPSSLPVEGVAYVGSNSIDAGIFQAEWVMEQLGGEGNVVIMNGQLDQEAAQKRTEGVKQVAAEHPGITIIREDTGNWDRAQGLALMENWLASGDQIDAVLSNNDEMAIGALSAIEAAGKLGEIIVAGVDASPDALVEMERGRLNVTVFQNAQGQGAGGIETALKLACGETVEDEVWIPYELVTPENFQEYMN